ncbi:putative Ubiquitin-like activating enzyme [Taphrina deformans PYCC 5710]|uniref:NEDD8-activating enzyme E1 regulatory subunit n=1 Tax=Taphrina deformans (strain PYCC 5710 / ATCC 11124 / CBS 356.35 / IMI 108563 / JCM 9778 / NBRC 8474) TaxID=1097556 RepID=R4X7S4_TAPDE|nr:putative Ubiquitin-like activating enzyme [Taphrina deformans PYCC 5710]|eukprot:CCG81238.1 putative Ubiquitin-like activating enzyme [Taphrina deformans PYCC 5710]
MAPLDKEVKYDRQLRLWAANGQAALENSRLALLHGTAVGTETLKNLVLPGIGSYTIIDGQTVTAQDTGVNFFLDVDSVGASRAQKTCEYLQELNADVVGSYLNRDPISLITDDPAYFVDNFDVVLVTALYGQPLQVLAETLWAAKIPLFVVDAIGFIGYLRVALPEHNIVETHPDAIVDLRLDNPWPELSSLAEDLDLESLNDNQHTHVPYVLLLLHYLAIWKDQHDGNAPKTFDEKSQFKTLIRSGMRNVDEDNFDEAVNNVWRACSTTNVPSSVQDLFDSPSAQELTPETDQFWFLVRAVADFVKTSGKGLLPVAGTIPDMKSDTNTYIQLQKTYRARAMRDIADIKTNLLHHLQAHGKPSTAIPESEIESFCKHAGYIKVIRYRSLGQQADEEVARVKQWMDEDDAPIYWYLAKRAAETYRTRHRSWPSHKDDALFAQAKDVFSTTTDEQNVMLERVCREMTRSGFAELHNIASLMGGVAAQEIIKVITKQYVPINNTVIFDGIKSVSAVYAL